MKKRKLMKPYLAGICLMTSVCMGTTAYADDSVQMEETIVAGGNSLPEEVSETEEIPFLDFGTDDDAPMESEEIPSDDPEEEQPESETDGPEDEETSKEDSSDPEVSKKPVILTKDEIYQGEMTELEADGFCDEDVEEILHEIFVLSVPKEVSVGTLTKPVFEEAEVSVLVKGEEVSSEDAVIDIPVKAEEIGIKVKPLGNTLKQVAKLVLTFTNDLAEQTDAFIETVLHRFFKDGTDEVSVSEKLVMKQMTVFLFMMKDGMFSLVSRLLRKSTIA